MTEEGIRFASYWSPNASPADIRAGRRRPHPRHWQALARLAGLVITRLEESHRAQNLARERFDSPVQGFPVKDGF